MPDPPPWSQLEGATRAALEAPGYDARWYADNPALRATVLLVSHRLRAARLWRFVGREDGSTTGCLHFRAARVEALRSSLAGDARFTARGDPAQWHARERRLTAALHLKHFRGWPPDRVQAHLDLAGLPQRWWWWLAPPVPAAMWIRHAVHYSSYLDVDRLWRAVTRGGDDPLTRTRGVDVPAR